MRAAALVLGIGLVAGCGGEPEIPLVGPYPADTAWVAAVLLDDAGREVASTGIAAFGAEASRVTLDNAPDASEAIVYAWSDAQLSGVLPSDAELRALPISLRRDGRAPLPSGWQGRSQPLGETVVPDAAELATAAWLPECPTLVAEDQEVVLDVRCASFVCSSSYRQLGCGIPVGLAGCRLPDLLASIDGVGNVSVAGEFPGQCSQLDPPPKVLASVRCEDCTIDVHIRSRNPLEPVPSEVVSLAPEPTADQRTSPPYHGRLAAMTVTPDAVHAVVLGNRGCGASGATLEVVTVDPVGLGVTERTVPGCESAVVTAAPDDAPILATQTSSGAAVRRFGASPAYLFLGEGLGPVLSITADAELDRVAVVVARLDAPKLSRLFLLRMSNLSLVAEHGDIDEVKGGLLFTRDGNLLAARNGSILVYAASDGVFSFDFMPGTGDGLDNDFHVLVPFGGMTSVGVSSNGDSGIHFLDGIQATSAGLAFGRKLIITSALEVPNPTDSEARGLAAGFAVDETSLEAELVRFVPEAARFRSQGRVVGRGPALDLGRDAHGHLWVRMPREGNLRRINIQDL
ncbi:MAG: hypothetical protein AAFZ18_29315 [Myxococcota bacterium]